MEIGQRIREARLAAGLSQRQLCGDIITRNMLSRIEHGAVRPSMTTLQALAARLGKSVSYFLDETVMESPNIQRMENARRLYAQGAFAAALDALADYQTPDSKYDWERQLLLAKCAMAQATEAMTRAQIPYARELLEQAARAGRQTPYYGPELERERLLLLAQTGTPVELPEDDRELLERAQQALAAGMPERAAQYLAAAQKQDSPKWNLLRGETLFATRNFREAIAYYCLAEPETPKLVATRLEHCYQAVEDYKMAYFYACKLREL